MGEVASIEPRAWETVLSRIESDLLTGELKPGDHLPPERQLAADLGVGRSSVREALRVLEVLGLVRTGTGSGPSAGAIIVATPSGGCPPSCGSRSRPTDSRSRTWSAPGSSSRPRSGSNSPSPASTSCRSARQLLDAMDEPTLTPAEFLALDQEFHRSLADASGNQVVVATMAGLRSAIEGYVTAGLPRIVDWNATSTRLREEHRGILRAIESGYTHSIRALIHDHIDGYYREVSTW